MDAAVFDTPLRQPHQMRLRAAPTAAPASASAPADSGPTWVYLDDAADGFRLEPRTRAGAVPALTQGAGELPTLRLQLDPGAHGVLVETVPPGDGGGADWRLELQLGAGAWLQHLRLRPARSGAVRQVHAQLGADARYDQVLLCAATAGSDRTEVRLEGDGARAHVGSVLLAAAGRFEHAVHTEQRGRDSLAGIETLVLAAGSARVDADARSVQAPRAQGARVGQRLAGIPVAGQPKVRLRPHLEILHDDVQAAHGATWGALPEEAVFFACQRGLDAAQARRLVLAGMAQAVLERTVEAADLQRVLLRWGDGGGMAPQPPAAADATDATDALQAALTHWLQPLTADAGDHHG
ncbi:MAG: SufD family Fe-S cluster assembly protein [Aquabacterium sp.]|nr:SufD family Fe-S cluster assembly protein [Aquabacterium sp.]